MLIYDCKIWGLCQTCKSTECFLNHSQDFPVCNYHTNKVTLRSISSSL